LESIDNEYIPRFKISKSQIGSGARWIRTTEDVRQQIYSLPHLATLVSPLLKTYFSSKGAGRGTRTPDQLITNQLLYQLSYTGVYVGARIEPRSNVKNAFFLTLKRLFQTFV
jgi:hypothetical protein